MSVSKRAALWLVLALNIVILLYAALAAGGSGAQPLRLSSVPSPEGTVEGFFRALSARDFDTADGYISNYRTLGLSDAPASGTDALTVYIYDRVFDSYSVSPAGTVSPTDAWRGGTVLRESEYRVTGSHAVVTFEYTCLDTSKVSEKLTGLLRDIGERTAGSGIAVDNDEKALELFGESVEKLEEDDVKNYYSQTALEVQLVYTDGRWKIVLTQELYDALCGRFPAEEAVSGTDRAADQASGETEEADGGERE